ncbi:uncharacterized protein [Antedon mediterranea]|uniref:uncharacterized protein n=1 Tax=Antedon mediterranea TaxID=105859 RepID=UPI003AF78117
MFYFEMYVISFASLFFMTKASPYCEADWSCHNEHCYYVFNDSSWQNASTECKKMNSTLASILNESENNFVKNLCSQNSTHCYIGLYNIETVKENVTLPDAEFVWADGTNLTFTKPLTETSFDSYKEYGVSIESESGNWHMSRKYNNPKRHDGFAVCKKRSRFAAECEPNWKYHNKHCYYLFNDSSWKNASNECEKMNSNLTSILNEIENNFVKNLCSQNSTHCYIGLYNIETVKENVTLSDAKFVWLDGTNLTFTPPWKPRVKHFDSYKKYGVSIESKSGKWWRSKTHRNPNWHDGFAVCKKKSNIEDVGIAFETIVMTEIMDITSLDDEEFSKIAPKTTEENKHTDATMEIGTKSSGKYGHQTLKNLLSLADLRGSGEKGTPKLELFQLSLSADIIGQSLLNELQPGQTESQSNYKYLNTAVFSLNNRNWSDVGDELAFQIDVNNCSNCHSVVLRVDLQIINASKSELEGVQMVGHFTSISVYSNRTKFEIQSTSFTQKKALANYIEDKPLNANCSFINNTYKSWSTDGCSTEIMSDGDVKCVCNHLTSFGILLQVNSYNKSYTDMIALDTISYVLLSISLISLVCLLSVYCFFRDLWNSTRIFIHTNLVINLIATYTLFLSGIDSTSKTVCVGVGVCLHFTVLNMFMWMMAEAVFIAFKVTKSFSTRQNVPRNYFIVCYGVSALVIVTTLSVDVDGNYRSSSPCWLNESNGAVYALVIPALIIITVNMIILVMTLRTVYLKSKSRQSRNEKSFNESTLKTMKATIFLLPVFGITWVFGPFAFSSASIVFEYIFVILNCPQGLAIFIVYCVMDVEVKEQFNIWRARSKRLKEAKSLTQQDCSV